MSGSWNGSSGTIGECFLYLFDKPYLVTITKEFKLHYDKGIIVEEKDGILDRLHYPADIR